MNQRRKLSNKGRVNEVIKLLIYYIRASEKCCIYLFLNLMSEEEDNDYNDDDS